MDILFKVEQKIEETISLSKEELSLLREISCARVWWNMENGGVADSLDNKGIIIDGQDTPFKLTWRGQQILSQKIKSFNLTKTVALSDTEIEVLKNVRYNKITKLISPLCMDKLFKLDLIECPSDGPKLTEYGAEVLKQL